MWRPGLGDPSIGGLGLTALYVVASLLMLWTIYRPTAWDTGERLLWGAATVLIVLMTINKQLDLQHYVNLVGRCWARQEGLADLRETFQRVFGLAVLALGLGATVWLGRATRPALRRNRPLIWGLGLLGLFLVVEVARFQHLLGAPGEWIERLRLHRMLEGTALLVLIWAAWDRIRR